MKCEHCGKLISISSCYCEHCGKPVKSIFTRIKDSVFNIFAWSITLCKKKKWLLPATLGVVAVVIAGSVILNRDKSLDFTEYVSFAASGYDGFGTLEASIDYDALAEAILGKAPDGESKAEYERFIEYNENKEELIGSVAVDVDRDTELQNGDFFLATVTVKDSELFEDNKISVKGSYTATFEIGVDTELLTKLTEVNLIDHVDVTFSGKNGNGTASIVHKKISIEKKPLEGEPYKLTFSYNKPLWGEPNFEVSSTRASDKFVMIKVFIENDSNLSNGDTVKVVLEPSEIGLAEYLGIKLTSLEREYTVSGLEE